MAMECDDQGFIQGVFNYCDRWCERCPFTSRCRVYAMEMTIQVDGVDGELTQAAEGLPGESAEDWSGEDVLAEAEDVLADGEWEQARLARDVADVIVETHPLAMAADSLAALAGPLIEATDARVQAGGSAAEAFRDPLEVLAHYQQFVAVKVRRALSGREAPAVPGCDDEEPSVSDADGSAKVARLACAAAREAARRLAARDPGLAPLAGPFTQTADRIMNLIDDAFPGHRAFRRPGFDGPAVSEPA